MSASTSKRYPVELRERAVRMVAEVRGDHESEWAAMTRVAELLGGRFALPAPIEMGWDAAKV
jgi:transposase